MSKLVFRMNNRVIRFGTLMPTNVAHPTLAIPIAQMPLTTGATLEVCGQGLPVAWRPGDPESDTKRLTEC